jgi:S1-C subfamily serine protease
VPLPAAYSRVRPSIVAILSDLNADPDPVLLLPPIIGSGFVVGSDEGLIVTAGHVIDALQEIQANDPNAVPGAALFFTSEDPVRDTIGVEAIPLPLRRLWTFTHDPGKPAIASAISEDYPDLGLAQIGVTGCPAVQLATEMTLVEGDTVGVAGFPLGEDLLVRVGAVGHLGPTLRSGVISARLASPEGMLDAGFLYEVLNQVGSSGSPVFDQKGTVVGVHVEWQPDTSRLIENTISGTDFHHTGLSVAVSARHIPGRIEGARRRTTDMGAPSVLEPADDWPTWEGFLEACRLRRGGETTPGRVTRTGGSSKGR